MGFRQSLIMIIKIIVEHDALLNRYRKQNRAERLLTYSNDGKIRVSSARWFSGELTADNLNETDLNAMLIPRCGTKNHANNWLY